MHPSNGDASGTATPSVEAQPLSSLPAPTRPLPLLSAQQTTGLCAMPWNVVAIQPDERSLVLVIPDVTQVVKGALITQTSTDITVTVYRTPPPTGPVTSASYHT
ncbi:MAG: hypothetical protein ACRDTS_19305, partial [Mycobacterium sp.]